MATLAFGKWEGTGNDFILVDDRTHAFPTKDMDLVRRLCDRHFGIGSDGLILLQPPSKEGTAYHMEFFNPDGSRSFCGNGSRCAFAFWSRITDQRAPARFSAIDGLHEAQWAGDEVRISMRPVQAVETMDPDTDLLDTGSPHVVRWVKDPGALDLVAEARKVRYADRFAGEGVNVNYARRQGLVVEVRTYERGVEGETLSCGTGVTAAALSAMRREGAGGSCTVRTVGGVLRVEASRTANGFAHIMLQGPVRAVFQGSITY